MHSILNNLGYYQYSEFKLDIILPIGISFYTFQSMSYTIDIFRGKMEPTKDFIIFSSFISFFPQLIAGPIEKATHLIPQLEKKRYFSYESGIKGLKLILIGFFKKVVIADSIAWRVDLIFESFSDFDGGVLLLGLIYFSVQIYCDFSGYSDIAIFQNFLV